MSTLTNLRREVPEYSHDDSTNENLTGKVDQPETQLTAQSEVSANTESTDSKIHQKGSENSTTKKTFIQKLKKTLKTKGDVELPPLHK